MKKKELNTAQRTFIEQNLDKSVEELEKDTGATVDLIQSYVTLLQNRPKNPDLSGFARNEKRGVVIMTEGASQKGDDLNKVKRDKLANYEDSIHRMKK